VTGLAAALFRRDRGDQDGCRRLLSAAIARLHHRGERIGVNVGEAGGLAVCERGASSGVVQSGDLSIVADARLDEREALAAELGLAAEASDPSVLLAAYERWGEGCAARLLGDFAFAVLDARRRTLFCARDPIGIRTLYHAEHAGVLRVASEMHALLAADDIPRQPDLGEVAMFVAGEYNEHPGTLYRHVHSLPPAHHMTAGPEGVRVVRYWQPDPWKRLAPTDAHDHARLVRDLIASAVGSRSRGVERVAVYVSGGTDSSSVAGETERLRRIGRGPVEPPLLVHTVFDGSSEDETVFSDAVAEMWDLPRVHTQPLADPAVTRPGLETEPDVPWEPRIGMWRLMLAESVSRGARVGFTGEGTDYCLRPTHVEWADDLRRGHLGRVARESRIARRPWSLAAWRAVWSRAVRPLVPVAVRRRVSALRGRTLDPILTPEHERSLRSRRWDRIARIDRLSAPDLVSRDICSMFLECDIPAGLAPFERLASHRGVELRHPFFDRRLIELFVALPHDERHVVGLDKPKPVLRAAMKEVLPPAVHRRRASGDYYEFFREVVTRQHRGAIMDLFRRSRLGEAGVVPPPVQRAIAAGEVPAGFDLKLWPQRLAPAVAMEIFLRQV
jgi:asparagine synthase (glutamine-hydrolysing)